LESFSIARPRP